MITSRPTSKPSGSVIKGQEGYAWINTWLRDQCGMHFPDQKESLLLQRLVKVLETYQLNDFDALANEIKSRADNEITAAVINAATTNHTYFFREPEVLDFYRQTILPGLVNEREIRLWSAASSTGDEAYTCAIIAAELFGRHAVQNRIAILGTDICGPVIDVAESGIYGRSNMEYTPKELVGKYFRRTENGAFKIADDIRRLCIFRRMNLKSKPFPFQNRFHVVFCRNVLYYFDTQTQHDVLETIYDVTAPGGWLLTSVTMSLRDLNTRWTSLASGIHRRIN